MKSLKLFLIFLLIGIIGAVGYLWLNKKKPNIHIYSPVSEQADNFSINNPPKEAKKGRIENMEGDVDYESRTATIAAKLPAPVDIQQGEKLATGKDGNIKVSFTDAGMIDISPDSEVLFAQTLPNNLVINQSKGMVEYQKDGSIPISVRSLNLLASLKDGTMKVVVDKDNATINIKVNMGNATVAYNDVDMKSIVINLNEGDGFVFDDNVRTGLIK